MNANLAFLDAVHQELPYLSDFYLTDIKQMNFATTSNSLKRENHIAIGKVLEGNRRLTARLNTMHKPLLFKLATMLKASFEHVEETLTEFFAEHLIEVLPHTGLHYVLPEKPDLPDIHELLDVVGIHVDVVSHDYGDSYVFEVEPKVVYGEDTEFSELVELVDMFRDEEVFNQLYSHGSQQSFTTMINSHNFFPIYLNQSKRIVGLSPKAKEELRSLVNQKLSENPRSKSAHSSLSEKSGTFYVDVDTYHESFCWYSIEREHFEESVEDNGIDLDDFISFHKNDIEYVTVNGLMNAIGYAGMTNCFSEGYDVFEYAKDLIKATYEACEELDLLEVGEA